MLKQAHITLLLRFFVVGVNGCFESGNQVQQFRGDGSLPFYPVRAPQFFNMFFNIFFCILQGSQAACLFTGQGLGLAAEKTGEQILADQSGKKLVGRHPEAGQGPALPLLFAE